MQIRTIVVPIATTNAPTKNWESPISWEAGSIEPTAEERVGIYWQFVRWLKDHFRIARLP